MSIFKKVWNWIKNAATTVEKKAIPIAIAVTEGFKNALNSGAPGFIANFIETVFPQVHNLPQQLVAILEKNIPKILAVELGLQALADGATQDEILAFEKAVMDAFNLHDNKSKLYSEIAAQVFYDTYQFAGGGQTHTFAEVVSWIESEFQKIKAEVETEAAN